MTKHYLTNAKSWVDIWDGKRYITIPIDEEAKLLKEIKSHRIPIHWRDSRVAEFVIHEIGKPLLKEPAV